MALLDKISTPLSFQQLLHLVRRSTFCDNITHLYALENKSIDEVLTLLFEDKNLPSPPIDLKTGSSWLPKPTEDINSGNDELEHYFLSWWMEQMRIDGVSAKEKLVYFLHTHFTTIRTVVENATMLYYQNALFRHYVLGSFKELALKICTDNAMLIFLDGRQNAVGNVQENFAREFLELYSIGKGLQTGPDDYTNYSEKDIQECARVFSGFEEDKDFTIIDPDTLLPKGKMRGKELIASHHDAGLKRLGVGFQNAEIFPDPAMVNDDRTTKIEAEKELQQLVDVIFNQEETAKNICRKLYRFYCYYNITDVIEKEVITPLSKVFIENDFSIQKVLEVLFSSNHFYDIDDQVIENNIRGSLIKSPLELVLQTLTLFDIPVPDYESNTESFYNEIYSSLIEILDEQGQSLYEPYEVAGYPAYHQSPIYNRNWISANYLGNRYLFGGMVVMGQNKWGEENSLKIDVLDFVENKMKNVDPSDPVDLVEKLVALIFPREISQERRDYFMKDILLDDLPVKNWQGEWLSYKSTGADMAVRQQLQNLFIALFQSPEYQLM